MAIQPRDRPHLYVEGGGKNEPYTSPRVVLTGLPPARARAAHAARLKQAVDVAIAQARAHIAAREEGIAEGAPGFYLQFEIPVEHQVAIDSLENKPKSIELVAVRPPAEGDETLSATVFVPEDSADFFDKRIEAYRSQETKTGAPKNQALIARIENVRLGAAIALFTDAPALFPAAGVPTWWEVWLRDGRLATFKTVAARLNVAMKAHTINFPERDVVLALADEATMERLIENSDAVAELRLAKDTPTLFLEMRAVEQADWAANLAALEHLNSGCDILRLSDFAGGDFEAERTGCRLNLPHLQNGAGSAGVAHDRQPAKIADNLAQKLETLAGSIGLLDRQASNVASGAGQAFNYAGANRVHLRSEHDRDEHCSLLCCEDWCRCPRDNDIDLEPDELGRDLAIALGTCLRPSILDCDGATLDPTEFP
jgi:hypothetical protein